MFGEDIDPDQAIALLDETTLERVTEIARGVSVEASVACVGPHEVAEFAIAPITGPTREEGSRVAVLPVMSILRLLGAAGVLLLVLASPAAAHKRHHHHHKPKDVEVQLLSFNDFHGHLEIAPRAAPAPDARQPTTAAVRPPAGGAEYLATHLRGPSARRRTR